jgi:hypothetical protein
MAVLHSSPIREWSRQAGRRHLQWQAGTPQGKRCYLEWRDAAKRVRLSVGKDPADASTRRQRKEAELNAVNNGVAVVPENGQNGTD